MQWKRQRNRNWQSDGQSNVDSMKAILVLIKLIRYVYRVFFLCRGYAVCYSLFSFKSVRFHRQTLFEFIFKSEIIISIISINDGYYICYARDTSLDNS